jgi:hypothetical protein
MAPGAPLGAGIDLNNRGEVLYSDDVNYWLRDAAGARAALAGTFTPRHLHEVGQVRGQGKGEVGRWGAVNGWQAIPDGGLQMTSPGGMDSFGRIVASHSVRTGQSPPRYAYYGHVFCDGLGWVDLNTQVDPGRSIRVKHLVGITDRGVLAAYGSIGPDNRAMLLEPRYVTTFGSGCATATGGEPKALVAGDPRPGGRIALLGSGAAPASPVLFLVSPAAASTPLPGGCTLLLDPASLGAIAVTANAVGQAALPVSVPAGVSGRSLHVQFAVLDPSAPNGAFSLSNGVRVDLP